MKRSTPVVLAILLTLAASPVASGAAETKTRGEWPLGLGTIDAVPKRYATHNANAAALRLMTLGAKLGIDFERGGPPPRVHRQISDYLEAQLVRKDSKIDAPPAEVADYLRRHDRDLKAVRDLLTINPVVWPVNVSWELRAPMPNVRAQLVLSRVLVARALANRSWDDLRAAAALQRGLWPRPEMLSQLIAMSSTRLILAAARRLPAPLPSWSNELLQFDARRGVIAAMQWEAFLVDKVIHSAADSNSVSDQLEELIKKPFDQMVAGEYDEVIRKAAVELVQSRACAFEGSSFDDRLHSQIPFWDMATKRQTPYFGAHWQRASRLTAERELTERVFAVRSGRAPGTSSNCSDGTWLVARDAAGATRIRFSREAPVKRPQLAIPLEQTVP